MLKFIRLTYTGLSDGALLALIALGLVLVFKATDVINFAQGEFMMLGAYLGYQAIVWLQAVETPGVIIVLGFLAMVLGMVAFGVMVERLVLRPLIGEPVISVIMVTIGLSNIIQAVVGAIWGKLPQTIPTNLIPIDGRFEIALEGARRPLLLAQDSFIIAISVLALVAVLILFFRNSKQGIAMRATADDQQAAMSMGISIKTIFMLTWSLAAVTAGIAGLLIADITNGVSGDIPGVGLRAFPVIILGGLDSIGGAVLGGFIIGLIEAYASGYIDPGVKTVTPYIVLLIVMMIKPYGLFGQKRIERV
ncbi:MAG: branched-chain amino acid ABC transporter permease [Anaerolinea sp.]|nr:branched-chain amino acid ABC transporter permease [Anaerolinea sp.]